MMDKCGFLFRGETLEEYGYALCNFNGSSSASTVETDSQKEYTTIRTFGGKYQPIVCNVYGDALTMELEICKDVGDESYFISPSESAQIKRWLSSPTPHELRLSDDKYSDYYWMGTFSVKEVHVDSMCVGFHLTFTSVAPFGYKTPVIMNGSVSAGSSVTIVDSSDDEGYIYPDIVIVVKKAGDLTITNSFDERITKIANCSSGEKITFTRSLQILSSNTSHTICDDFNFKFVRIGNSYSNPVNKLTFNLPCEYAISYSPIAKVVTS